jgi:phenylpropionate dioxygenase-like ring-hydroxylating dioxygenase large terminal subunit
VTRYVSDGPDEFRVATAAYRERTLFEAELHEIFYRNWIYLGHESEVPGDGDYKTTWIGRQPVIMVRHEGGVRAFLNFCPHRGATLCREARGNARTFVCPYHAWSFRTSGDFIGAPQADRYPPAFKSRDRNLRPVARVESYAGLVFGSLSLAGPTLVQHLGEARAHVDLWLDRCAGGKYNVCIAHKYAYRGNWKFQAENAVDGYHAGFVHQSAFAAFRKFEGAFPNRSYLTRNVGRTRAFPGGHATLEAGVALESGFTTPSDRQAYRDALVRLNGEARAQEIINNRHLLIFPNLLLMDGNIRVIQPISHEYTEVYSYPAAIDGVPESVVSGRLRDVQMRIGTAGMLNPDDVEVFNGVQNAISAAGAESIVLSRGIGMEEMLPSGERVGAFTDETPQRSFWRQWSAIIESGAGGS